jgi:hypothetical protein
MWEPQPLATLRASTACTGKTLPLPLPLPYICPIPNDFRDRVISLYSSKIVDKKDILLTVPDTGIYCSSGKVGTVYKHNTFSKIPPSTSVHFATLVRTWRVARLYSVQWKSSISETVRNRTHVHILYTVYIFWEVVGLERGPLSLVRIIEALLE